MSYKPHLERAVRSFAILVTLHVEPKNESPNHALQRTGGVASLGFSGVVGPPVDELGSLGDFTTPQIMSPFDKSVIEEIKLSIESYPAEKRSVYLRGLREGIDIACSISHDRGFELAKDIDVREFLDYLDSSRQPEI